MLRSLMFDFAQDEAVKELKEEFMYGPSYLVCPVTDPMEYGPESTPIATSGKVEIYLPKGGYCALFQLFGRKRKGAIEK